MYIFFTYALYFKISMCSIHNIPKKKKLKKAECRNLMKHTLVFKLRIAHGSHLTSGKTINNILNYFH